MLSYLIIFLYIGWSISRFMGQLNTEIFSQPYDCLKVSVPAISYVVQNNLLFLALSKLDAATYQVRYFFADILF